MKNLYLHLEQYWFKLNQPLRFLLVGGFNTFAALGIFMVLSFITDYTWSLIYTYIISINLSFLTLRHYVFQTRTNFRKEYLKALLSYLSCFIFNYLLLWFLVEKITLSPVISQTAYTVISTCYIYLIHKKFTFR